MGAAELPEVAELRAFVDGGPVPSRRVWRLGNSFAEGARLVQGVVQGTGCRAVLLSSKEKVGSLGALGRSLAGHPRIRFLVLLEEEAAQLAEEAVEGMLHTGESFPPNAGFVLVRAGAQHGGAR